MGMSRFGVFLGLALLACRAPGREEPFRLQNGLTVLVRPVAGASQAAVVVLFSVGSDHDPEGRSGMGHLLEHLYVTAAAGPAKARTAQEFMVRYPSGSNAQTGERYTVIASVVPKASLEEELKDAAARMGDLRIEAADLDRERPRLLAELENMFGGIPELGARNLAAGAVRPAPRGGRKGGIPAHVSAITLEDLRERWKKYYKPVNAILSVAGACTAEEVRTLAERCFGPLPPGEPSGAPASPGEPRPGGVEKASGAGRAAAVAYAAPEPGSDLYAPFLVLVARLWKRGGDAFPVIFAPMDDPSTLSVGVRPRAGETEEAALGRAEAFVAGTVGPAAQGEDTAGALNAFGFLMGLSDLPDAALAQNPYGVAFSRGRRHQLGLDPARLREAILNVKDDDLRRARELFSPARRAAALVSPR
jgi:zinc protease